MKTLTVKQPWASLIVSGIKDIENRTWKTNFRGRILIHAGMAKTSGMMAVYLNRAQYAKFRESVGFSGLDFIEPIGAIIGSVEIVDCVVNHSSIWAEKTISVPDEDINPKTVFEKPAYNWVLANPIIFKEPIPCKGKLSFWEFDETLIKE